MFDATESAVDVSMNTALVKVEPISTKPWNDD
jgi:hypothetical protein